MMFNLAWTVEADSAYKELKAASQQSLKSRKQKGAKKSSQAEGLFKQVAKAIKLLKENPKHPGLKTHEYDSLTHFANGKKVKVFEAYAQNNTPGAYRIFWCYGPKEKEITIISITEHP
jgi:mRNA-degrading endonuclease RelE of RelBE toxin-antitoxin system